MHDPKHEHEPPFLTASLPGTGGRIRARLEDFVVEELPLYEPIGAGEHLFLHIQKTGISTHEAIRRIARALGLPPRRIGYAGLKDSRSLSRQMLSVQGVSASRAAALLLPGIQVLEVRPHRNKLRVGHLRGNRFVIRIRDVTGEGAVAAAAILTRLAESGTPNFFGAQRFGSSGEAPAVGKSILMGDAESAVRSLLGGRGGREGDPRLREARRRFESGDLTGALSSFPRGYRTEREVLLALVRGRPPEQALRRIPRGILKLILSSYQSLLFNRLVAGRMPDLHRLEQGDLAYLHDRGAAFRVEDPRVEQPRADRLEISPSAPLFGRKVVLAEGRPGDRERELLEAEGLTREHFGSAGIRMAGERRPMRIPITEHRVRPDGDDAVLLSFVLPRGAYATVVLREVLKTDDPELGVQY